MSKLINQTRLNQFTTKIWSKIKEKYNVDYFEYVENGTQLEVSLDEEDYNIYKEYIVEE